MAIDTKITDLTAQTTPDDADLFVDVDVSDTTMSATGTDKKITWANIKATLLTYLQGVTSSLLRNHDGWQDANETWTRVSVDDPTGVFKVNANVTTKYSLGMRITMVENSITYYGIITKIGTYGGDEAGYTYITFLHEIDPADSLAKNLLGTGAITNNKYSSVKAPFGFPLEREKWTILSTSTSNQSQATPTSGTWYNALNIVVPIGSWDLSYSAEIYADRNDLGQNLVRATLSTANNSESDNDFHTEFFDGGQVAGVIQYAGGSVYKNKAISLTTKTTYYLNYGTAVTGIDQVIVVGTNQKTIQRAVCNYL